MYMKEYVLGSPQSTGVITGTNTPLCGVQECDKLHIAR